VFSPEPEYPSEPKKKIHPTDFDEETKIDVIAYQLKASLEYNYIEKIEELTSDSQNCFSFLVRITETSEKLVNVGQREGIKCRLSSHKYLNQIKGVLYTYGDEFNYRFKKDPPFTTTMTLPP